MRNKITALVTTSAAVVVMLPMAAFVSASADLNCDWNITGVTWSQKIPAE